MTLICSSAGSGVYKWQVLGWLKESGLLNLLIPTEFGGAGERWSTALKIAREFAKVDGALGHLYGYHFGSQHAAHLRGTAEQAADIFRRSAAGNWFWGNTANSFSKSLFGRRDADGFVLDGFRPFTSGSHIADYLQVAWEDRDTNARSFAAIRQTGTVSGSRTIGTASASAKPEAGASPTPGSGFIETRYSTTSLTAGVPIRP